MNNCIREIRFPFIYKFLINLYLKKKKIHELDQTFA